MHRPFETSCCQRYIGFFLLLKAVGSFIPYVVQVPSFAGDVCKQETTPNCITKLLVNYLWHPHSPGCELLQMQFWHPCD